jgi:hypothetical protein
LLTKTQVDVVYLISNTMMDFDPIKNTFFCYFD